MIPWIYFRFTKRPLFLFDIAMTVTECLNMIWFSQYPDDMDGAHIMLFNSWEKRDRHKGQLPPPHWVLNSTQDSMLMVSSPIIFHFRFCQVWLSLMQDIWLWVCLLVKAGCSVVNGHQCNIGRTRLGEGHIPFTHWTQFKRRTIPSWKRV